MEDVHYSMTLATILALIVGVFSGIVEAGDAFLLVPIMLVALRLPTRVTVATSLAITFISSIGATVGKFATDQVLLFPVGILVVASLIAAPLGAMVGQKVNQHVLKWVLALLITATVIKIWSELFIQIMK